LLLYEARLIGQFVKTKNNDQNDHPFISSPHSTLFFMSLPLLLSLVAEPLTGLVDTAFISRLGSSHLAAVGIGSTALTSIFWAFNFLSIGTQTEIAKASGRQEIMRVKELSTLAIFLSLMIGIVLVGFILPLSSKVVNLMGATEEMENLAISYFQIRVYGAPAILITFASFGILRGLQDMQAQLKIAVCINLFNVFLDPILIYGIGPIPGLGVSGAAWASTLSQWFGAIWSMLIVYKGVGLSKKIRLKDGYKLLQIGGNLFARTGMLTFFLVLTTRIATLNGPDTGAAHQALRQFWIFTALFLDAYAIAGQSLVGYFLGKQWHTQVLRVAKVVCLWSIVIGVLLSLIMIFGQGAIEYMIVPATAIEIFQPAWMILCVFQPLNALAFGTEGIHWGTGDFRFLRNVMMFATVSGVVALYLLRQDSNSALTWIWLIIGFSITIRAIFGVARIWPGFGKSPFKYK